MKEKKYKHMTLDDRVEIQECLDKGMFFKDIAKAAFQNVRSQHADKPYARISANEIETLLKYGYPIGCISLTHSGHICYSAVHTHPYYSNSTNKRQGAF